MRLKEHPLLNTLFFQMFCLLCIVFFALKLDGTISLLMIASILMLPFCLICLSDLTKPISLFGGFGVLWYLACAMEGLKLSRLQYDFSSTAAIIIFLVPLLFLAPSFFYTFKQPIELNLKEIFKYKKTASTINRLVITLSFSYIIFLFLQHKLPIFSSNPNYEFRNLLPNIIQVLWGTALRMGYGFCLYVGFTSKNRTIFYWFGLLSYFVIAIVLTTRSDIIYYVILTVVFYFMYNKKSILNHIKSLLMLLIIVIAFFSILGNIRQGDNFDINKYSDSKIDSISLNWFNSYFGFNITNLGTQIDKGHPTYTPSYTLQPIVALFQIKKDIPWYNTTPYPFPRLNMATGYNDFVIDFGGLGGLIPLFFYACLIIFIFTRRYSTEGKLLICSLIQANLLLFPFFNEFTRTLIWLELLFLIVLDRYCMIKGKGGV